MNRRFPTQNWLAIFVMTLILQACNTSAPMATRVAASTSTPQPPKPTLTLTPSVPLFASSTAKPTRTPNKTATVYMEAWKTSLAQETEAAQRNTEKWNAETQRYFELGYLKTSEGKLIEYADFSEEWAQLGWYTRWTYWEKPADFYMSGHLKWSSAYRSADISGCGFIFAEQVNGDHYAVFLDRSKILFVETEYYYLPIGTTRGTGRVEFGNPFDKPAEADFTLIVKGAYAYVLVNGEVVGEYTLSQSKILRGRVGVAILSGTNKDFGTRCEITNLHLWIPND